jgi:hypothetical protein
MISNPRRKPNDVCSLAVASSFTGFVNAPSQS